MPHRPPISYLYINYNRGIIMTDSITVMSFEKENNVGEVAAITSDRQLTNDKRSGSRKARKEAKFTARLNQDDFEGIKRLAVEKGMPYQTLLGHIIHLDVGRKLVDVTELQKVFDLKKIG